MEPVKQEEIKQEEEDDDDDDDDEDENGDVQVHDFFKGWYFLKLWDIFRRMEILRLVLLTPERWAIIRLYTGVYIFLKYYPPSKTLFSQIFGLYLRGF